jgi:hypothetical protein
MGNSDKSMDFPLFNRDSLAKAIKWLRTDADADVKFSPPIIVPYFLKEAAHDSRVPAAMAACWSHAFLDIYAFSFGVTERLPLF